jgi:hypothetical protein
VICAPSSLTRFAISCREISTLSSVMAFHIKLRNVACTTAFRLRASMPGFRLRLSEHAALSAVKVFYRRVRKERSRSAQRNDAQLVRPSTNEDFIL